MAPKNLKPTLKVVHEQAVDHLAHVSGVRNGAALADRLDLIAPSKTLPYDSHSGSSSIDFERYYKVISPEHGDDVITRLRSLTRGESRQFVKLFLEHHASLSTSDRAEAVFLSEAHFIADEERRAEFAEALLANARTLLEQDPTSLAARIALRKFASLAPATSIAELGEFLGSSHDLVIKQTALESIWNGLATEPARPSSSQASTEVQARVAELVALYGDPEWLCSSQGRVVHAVAVLADLVLSGDDALTRLADFLSSRSSDTADAIFLVKTRIEDTAAHVSDEPFREIMASALALIAGTSE